MRSRTVMLVIPRAPIAIAIAIGLAGLSTACSGPAPGPHPSAKTAQPTPQSAKTSGAKHPETSQRPVAPRSPEDERINRQLDAARFNIVTPVSHETGPDGRPTIYWVDLLLPQCKAPVSYAIDLDRPAHPAIGLLKGDVLRSTAGASFTASYETPPSSLQVRYAKLCGPDKSNYKK